ncbi:MAG: M20 family metallopeptidase [Chloroflexi bacterium]|nr:M20 family metallopeptidase [Chloroflexota bacterium]
MNPVSYLEQHLSDYMADLRELVEFDSGSHNKAGVDRAATIMAGHLESIGCQVERIPLTDYGDCVVGRLRGNGRLRLLLLGHLDTVYPDGTAAQRPLRIEGNRAYGPGVADMKSGLLTGVYALRALREAGFEDFEEIAFFCNSEEEVGSPASRRLYTPLANRADAAFVLESARADGSIVTERKGGGTIRVRVLGRAAHAGVEPEKGASAILELAHLIVAAHRLNGVRPGTTVNVGVARGGTRSNVVPDHAEAAIDVRIMSVEDQEAVWAGLHAEAMHPTVPGTQVILSSRGFTPPMPRTPATALLAKLAQAEARQLGFTLTEASTGGRSDGNFCAAGGTPVLDGLGPIGGDDHSPREYLEVDSIVPRTALLAGLIARTAEAVDQLRGLRG